jgi:hypothetical protein
LVFLRLVATLDRSTMVAMADLGLVAGIRCVDRFRYGVALELLENRLCGGECASWCIELISGTSSRTMLSLDVSLYTLPPCYVRCGKRLIVQRNLYV